MNERIKELAIQAGMVSYPTGLGISENTIWGDRNIAMFAELIIKECDKQNRFQSYELDMVFKRIADTSEYLNSKSLMNHFETEKHFVVESSLLKSIKS